MDRRTLIGGGLLLAAPALTQAALSRPAFAQPSNRPVRVIVPYGPGGSSDIVARILTQRAGEITGQSFVVENRGGGASVPGTQQVATAPPDGSTLGTADNALVLNPFLLAAKLPYDTEKDLGALGLAVTAPALLLAHPDAPARSVADVLAEARGQAGGLGISHGGIGAPTHLTAVQFQLASGVPITLVGYRGGGPQLTGLVTGDVRYGFVAISSALGQVQGGRLRPIAITSQTRSPLLPEVPTMAEAGLPAVDALGWWGFIMPAGVPPAVVARLHAAIVAPAREPATAA
ncbi:MAG: tripartite tricarboxylate transporter substrate binding protein, partial [Belnapia sp.]|nr:tripartite tricarboxylate transporter substrate binding protein [Belnapia sp.]